MKATFKDALENSPIISAVKNEESLKECLKSESQIVFVLYGDIITIPDIVARIKMTNKIALVHVDLIQGLQSKEIAVDFIQKNTLADGVISTKAAVVQRAKDLGLFTVMRFFMIDSMAYETMQKQIKTCKPDVIEILPALMPKVLTRIVKTVKCPVIAGGLVNDKEDVMSLLDAGATCVSSTNPEVWGL